MKFIHTSDIHIGKPFARVEDEHKRVLIQQERLDVLDRIRGVAEAEQVGFVLVAGDFFDSPTMDKAGVSAACFRIGQFGIPVLVIPGNHDHCGPGSVWEQDFFLREQRELAPNLMVLTEPRPVEVQGAYIFPGPLVRRMEGRDTLDWLASGEVLQAFPGPRIILAHGSVHGFTAEEPDGHAVGRIDIQRLPEREYDYLALGDWHAVKEVHDKAWYCGSPEQDRFPKGDAYTAGQVLVVEARRGQKPEVRAVPTGRLCWVRHAFTFGPESGLDRFRAEMEACLQSEPNKMLLELDLFGTLDAAAAMGLRETLESLEARLLRLKLNDGTIFLPADQEVEDLISTQGDPLLARVCERLRCLALEQDPEKAGTAEMALRELFAAVVQDQG